MNKDAITRPRRGLVITTHAGNKYEIISDRSIGGGAQGDVYVVESDDGTKKAIKFYHGDYFKTSNADPEDHSLIIKEDSLDSISFEVDFADVRPSFHF